MFWKGTKHEKKTKVSEVGDHESRGLSPIGSHPAGVRHVWWPYSADALTANPTWHLLLLLLPSMRSNGGRRPGGDCVLGADLNLL